MTRPWIRAIHHTVRSQTKRGTWIKSKIVFNGDTTEITYGGYHTKFNHQSIEQKKGDFTISFESGEIAVRYGRRTKAI